MLTFGAIVAAGALALTGCSGGSSSGSSSSGGVTSLDWVIWGNTPPEIASAEHIASLVPISDPNLTVKVQTMSWPDYWTKLPTTLAGGSPPCLVSMQMGHVREFADSLLPLDSLLASASINVSDFDPGIMKALQVDGKQLAIPYDLGPIVLYYNKDKFKAAGLAEPKNGWTIDEFVADAKKLTSGSNYGFSMDNTLEAMEQWAPTLTGSLPVTDSGKLAINTPEMISVLDWYGGLVNKEKVAAPVIASPGSTASVAFLGGTAAMYTDGPWAMINNKAQAKFNMGIVTVPAGPKGVTGPIEGSGFGISKKCGNPTAAIKALAVLTGPDALGYMGDIGRAYPARTAQQASWYKNAVDGSKATLEAAMKNGVPFRATTYWTEDGLNYSQGVVSVINGTSSAADMFKTMQDQSQSK
jgi:multiple sugar transport system substrate-binding protein